MTVIVKDAQGNIVIEKELNEKDCTIKVTEEEDGTRTYSVEQAAGAYH